MLVALYRKCISPNLRAFIYKLFLGDFLVIIRNPKHWIKHKWYKIYYSIVTPKTEKEQAYKAWSKTRSCLTPYPYLWLGEYEQKFIDVHVEQDERSAHRYVVSYSELTDKVLLDIGAAEAIFALDTIEYVNHAYLFECDERWLEALKATFAPWKEKVTIVRKYVSDINDENSVTLDFFFSEKQTDDLFLKMDIEGNERKALEGAKKLLRKAKNISGSVCIYHLHDDKNIIQKLLDDFSFITEIQSGYLIWGEEFRSAILRFRQKQ